MADDMFEKMAQIIMESPRRDEFIQELLAAVLKKGSK